MKALEVPEHWEESFSPLDCSQETLLESRGRRVTPTPGDRQLKCHPTRGKYDDADDMVASGSTDKDIYAYLEFICHFIKFAHFVFVAE